MSKTQVQLALKMSHLHYALKMRHRRENNKTCDP